MRIRTLALAAVMLALAAGMVGRQAGATHSPANKVAVAGSTLEIMTADLTSGTASQVETLLTGSIKTSTRVDLVFQVTAECALWTNTKNVGDSDSEAVAQVKIWVLVDGKTVGVNGADSGPEAGRVVFCDRAFRNVMSGFSEDNDDDDDSTETIELFQRTRSANAFNWIKLNLGRGAHSITVVGQLDTAVNGVGMAKAAIGRRTLVVEPTHLASDVVL